MIASQKSPVLLWILPRKWEPFDKHEYLKSSQRDESLYKRDLPQIRSGSLLDCKLGVIHWAQEKQNENAPVWVAWSLLSVCLFQNFNIQTLPYDILKSSLSNSQSINFTPFPSRLIFIYHSNWPSYSDNVWLSHKAGKAFALQKKGC